MPGTALFGFSSAERVALDAIREDRPAILGALRKRLAPVLDELAQTSQGLVATEQGAEDLLDQLRDEFVGRMIVELEPWGEDEDLRGMVVELVVRQILAEARAGFVRRVVGVKFS